MTDRNTELDAATPAQRPFYGKPFWWLIFALALTLFPIAGHVLQADMTWSEIHPALNAVLNGACLVFLIAGFIAVRSRNIGLHKRCMIAAVAASTLFLISYATRYYLSGSHRYPGDGGDKIVYLIILFSHMVLATAIVPMVLRTVYLAWRRRFVDHKKIARWTWPMWIYVSLTGVVVYLMLYPIANALYGS